MALIKIGSMNDFAVRAKEDILNENMFLEEITTFSALKEVSANIPEDAFELITSEDKRGVGLHSIMLTDGFEGFLQNYLNKTNEVYFVAWAYDFSGQAVNYYPGLNIDFKDVIIPIKVGKISEFIGEGINIFPKRFVKGGIGIRIQLWESDAEVRNFGKAMTETVDTIKKSELNNLLSLVTTTTGISGATVVLIKNAAMELGNIIGNILQNNGDDYVDLFEGYYAADQKWEAKDDTYTKNSSIITLRKY